MAKPLSRKPNWGELTIQGVVTFVLFLIFKFIWKLLEDAGLNWINAKIGKAVGPVIAPITSVIFTWGPPLILAILTLVAYHFAILHVRRPSDKGAFDDVVQKLDFVSYPGGSLSVSEPEEWLSLEDAARRVYDATRHGLLSGISRHMAETETEIIRETAEEIFHRAEHVRGKLRAATSFDELSHKQREGLVVFDDVNSVGQNGMLAPEFHKIEVHINFFKR